LELSKKQSSLGNGEALHRNDKSKKGHRKVAQVVTLTTFGHDFKQRETAGLAARMKEMNNTWVSGFGGLEAACSPLVPKFAGSSDF
jgi:hypothetical protein